MIPLETRYDIIEDYVNGFTHNQLAEKYKIAKSSVGKIVKDIKRDKNINQNGGRPAKVFTIEEKKRIIKAYQAGIYIKHLAKQNHVEEKIIKGIIEEVV